MSKSNLFNSVPIRKVKRTAFDLSHEVKSSFRIGQLVPFLCTEVLPGDVFKINAEHLVRFAPMLAPIMHRVDVYTHFFFVPNRLIWDDWENFITGGEDGTLQPVWPNYMIQSNQAKIGTLADFLGIPISPDNVSGIKGMVVSALPFRAYWEIYNNYYVDQNVGSPINYKKGSGGSILNPAFNKLMFRAWEKDYFTSALPFPQRLPNPVSLPITGDAELYYQQDSNTFRNPPFLRDTRTGEPLDSSVSQQNVTASGGDGSIFPQKGQMQVGTAPVAYDPNGTLKVDMSNVSAVTINELRRASKLQQWLETSARVGSRYIEQILGHFGVRSSDARLQRPEYLGGGKTPVVISEVEQTSMTQTDTEGNVEGTPLGQLGGQGTSYGSTHSFKRKFEEHGFVMGIVSVLPKPAYQDGLSRMWTRKDKFDYYWPEFANLGEQEIKEREIYYNWLDSVDGESNSKTFGYTPRYAEYRYMPSSVHGDFRESLDFWHMGRKFSNPPGLNQSFVTCDSTVTGGPQRVFAVEDVDHLWVQTYVKFNALRKMPKYGKPGL